MSAEVKSKGVETKTVLSKSAHKKFKSHVKKHNVSMAQRIRDLIQQDLKG